jgi:anti-sigma regulatory factor (Ser/Thr protein kinase)
VRLPFDTASVPAARQFVRAHIADWPGDRHIVELLTTELATNAILHAQSAFALSLAVDNDRVRVEVKDASPVIPKPPTPPAVDSVSGRGLFLVASLATRWGTDGMTDGKCIWFEVAA